MTLCIIYNYASWHFSPYSTLSQFDNFTLYHFPCLIHYVKRRFFAYIAASAYHAISKGVKNHVFRHNWIFRHTCMYKQTTVTKFSDTVGGYFLSMLSTPRKNKVLVTEKCT